MGNPIVIAHYLTFTFYGCWLPNDPRGSTSGEVFTDRLAELGEHYFGRKRVQPRSPDILEFYENADEQLQYPRIECDAADLPIIAFAFEQTIALHEYTCWACAIMRDHVHLLIRKHRHLAEEMIENFQNESRAQLVAAGRRTISHPTWTKGGGKFFCYHPRDVRRNIRYIEQNPVKQRRPVQRWGFVKPYDDWPLHVGHSPKSPYVVGLKNAGLYTPQDAARSNQELSR